ncbi:MAG: MFS family permease [Alphaproteobacteria bacterium]|jgi:FSR family fosmidomycin resistance protein-like MFS transporter
MSATDAPAPLGWKERAPLFVIAGAHGSLHWSLAIFYLLLPFIKDEYGMNYSQIGALASLVHVCAFAINIPSGVIVDVTGKRTACQLTALVFCGLALMSMGWATEYWMLAVFIGVVGAMNTLWHPAAISFLSSSYAERRGLALSFHTVGASLGDAAAPAVAGLLISIIGWQGTAITGGVVPILAAALLLFAFGREGPTDKGGARKSSLHAYLTGLRGLVRESSTWKVCIMSGFRGTSQVGLRTFLPLYFVAEYGSDPFWLGMMVMTLQVTGAVTTPFAGVMSDRIGRRPVLMIGFAGSALIMFTLPWIPTLPMLMAVIGMAGVFVFAVRPVLQSWALDMTPPQLGGSMVSLLFGTQSLFAMAVPILGGMIADAWGLDYVFHILAGAVVIAAFIAMTIPDDVKAETKP